MALSFLFLMLFHYHFAVAGYVDSSGEALSGFVAWHLAANHNALQVIYIHQPIIVGTFSSTGIAVEELSCERVLGHIVIYI